MVKISVILVRAGEDINEVAPAQEAPRKDLPRMQQLYQPSLGMLENISSKIDPELTVEGFRQAEGAFRAIAKVFDTTNDIRKFGYFSAPFKRCVSSAMMISVAGFEPKEWSNWGLTTPETAGAPTGIPIVVMDGLADCNEQVTQLGGLEPTLKAGLLLCAAQSWNKAYKKDPIMGEIQKWKNITKERIQIWQDEPLQACEASQRFVADTQYLRFEDVDDPYSLKPMSLKFNIPTDLIQPKQCMQPPRQGMFDTKKKDDPPPVGQATLDLAVQTGRKAGCDTLIFVVTSEMIRDLCERCGQEVSLPMAGDIASFVAKPKSDCVSWKFHALTQSNSFLTSSIPRFSGPIEPSVEMPPDFATAMEAVGEEQWGNFPPPPPENISKNYPKDIPAFGQCLELPAPKAKWSYQHQQKKHREKAPETEK
jgi:hypothetical protein